MKERESRKTPLDYPLDTEGSRLATEIRKRANKLTREQRRDYFRQGMAIIYGGKPASKTTGPGY